MDETQLILLVETVGVVLAGIGLLAAGWKLTSSMYAKLREHDLLIAETQREAGKTAAALERTLLIVARLEERTKDL